MSRRRRPQVSIVDVDRWWIRIKLLPPVEAARRERVARQMRRVKRRAAKRWTA